MALNQQQVLVKEFLAFDTPYRGLLLYHLLGSGKSCTSIAAAEGFVGRHKRVIVLLPASLEMNYRGQILKCSTVANVMYGRWSLYQVKQSAETARALGVPLGLLRGSAGQVWFPTRAPLPELLAGLSPLRADIPYKTLTQEDRRRADQMVEAIIDARYHFINYNGLTTQAVAAMDPALFDDAFVIIDEAHNFVSRVVNDSRIAKKVYNMVMNAKGMKLTLLSGTPVINHPFELCVLLNLVRGPIEYAEVPLLPGATAAGTPPTAEDLLDLLGKQGLAPLLDQLEVLPEDRTIRFSLLPVGYQRAAAAGAGGAAAGAKIVREPWPAATRNSPEWAHKAVHRVLAEAGYAPAPPAARPRISEGYALPGTKKGFEEMFLDITDPMNPKLRNPDLFQRRILGIVSYFRSVNDPNMPRVNPKTIDYVPMSEYQFGRYGEVRGEELRMEDMRKKMRQAQGAGAGGEGLFDDKNSVYRAFSRMACNFVFPENIQRIFPKDVREAMKEEVVVVDEDEELRTSARDVRKEAKKKEARQYQESLAGVLRDLARDAGEVLTQEKLTQAFSPKFAKVIARILESPGTALVYSQFRTIEGLGVFSLALEEAGFVRLDLVKEDGEWGIRDAARVLDPRYDRRRYIIFDEDREKSELLLRMFNNQAAAKRLGGHPRLLRELHDGAREQGANLRGELARVFMITQSGSEGISLMNVRTVHVLEPFWNMVRMDQVVGRAARTGSHLGLPEEERDVTPYIYASVLTPQQVKKNVTLSIMDQGKTSDVHLMEIATRKDAVIQQFLTLLKQASFDCLLNANANLPLENAYKCYMFPINLAEDAPAYAYTLTDEAQVMNRQRMEQRRSLQGRAVLLPGAPGAPKTKAVEVPGLPGYYDYDSYTLAGVLVPVTPTPVVPATPAPPATKRGSRSRTGTQAAS